MWRKYRGIIILVIVVGIGYGGHVLYRYSKIRADSAERAAEVVRPRMLDYDVSEIGYIYEMRDEVFLRDDNRVNLVWFIKVPATGSRYSCQYEGGYPDFEMGNDVRIIHPKDLSAISGYGYVVGLHDKLTGKAAFVHVNDLDELETDMPEPDTHDPD